MTTLLVRLDCLILIQQKSLDLAKRACLYQDAPHSLDLLLVVSTYFKNKFQILCISKMARSMKKQGAIPGIILKDFYPVSQTLRVMAELEF